MPRGTRYRPSKKSDPALINIKQYDAAIYYAQKALEKWKTGDYLTQLVKTEKALNVISRNKLPMIPQLAPLYHYYQKLLLKAEGGSKESLEEFIRHLSELRATWIEARNNFKQKGFKEE